METEQNIPQTEPTVDSQTAKHTPDSAADASDAPAADTVTPVKPSGAGWAWTAIFVAAIAWVLLMMSNGYVALTAGVVATVMSIVALCRSHRAMHRLAVTALIASLVLVVILGAFLIVIKIGLSA